MVIIEQESILISDSEEFSRMALWLSGLGTELQIGSQWFNPRANSSFLTEEKSRRGGRKGLEKVGWPSKVNELHS